MSNPKLRKNPCTFQHWMQGFQISCKNSKHSFAREQLNSDSTTRTRKETLGGDINTPMSVNGARDG
jgi:hypothetical protein